MNDLVTLLAPWNYATCESLIQPVGPVGPVLVSPVPVLIHLDVRASGGPR